jgi:hypothetical protein
MFFPAFSQGPYALMDSKAASIWMNYVNEVKPLIDSNSSPLQTVSTFLLWIGSSLLALPFLITQIANPHIVYRRLWNFLIWSSLIFIALALYQIRWSSYAQILLIFPVAFFLLKTFPWIEKKTKAPWTRPLKVFISLLLSICFPLLGEVIKPQSLKITEESTLTQSAPVEELSQYLLTKSPMRIVCLLDIAPEILYRTNHEVIGTPYHRNGSGIWDTYAIMTDSGDYSTAKDLIKHRGITHLLIFNNDREKVFYQTDKKDKTLWQNLNEGMISEFLEEEPLPENLKKSFKLFNVITF